MATGLTIASTIYSAYQQKRASDKAAGTQERAAEQSSQLQWDMFQQSRQDTAPWRAKGAWALKQLKKDLQKGFKYQESPDYKFTLGESINALDKSLSARGRVQSGEATKEVMRLGAGLASQDLDKAVDRWLKTTIQPLQSLAGLGQNSAETSASNALKTGTNIGETYQDAGDARASGYINQANVMSNTMGNALTLYGMYKN